MKSLLLVMAVFFGVSAHAASPFVWSGNVIQAIFKSPLIWKKVAGNVELIKFEKYAGKVSKFSVSTTENVPVIDASGRTTGYRQVPCTLGVEVSWLGDEFAPKLEVTKVDFAACPETSIP